MKSVLKVVLIMVVAVSSLMAEDIWVQAGNNTITAALATAEAGDRLVLVEEGVYSNDPLFVYKPVTIAAFDGLASKPVVSYLWSDDDVAGQETTLFFTYASLTLEGLELTMEGDPVLTAGTTTRMIRNRAYVGVNYKFYNCLFRDAAQASMSISSVNDSFKLADGSWVYDGVDYFDNDPVVIDGVTVAQDGTNGVLDTLIIDNSVFKNFIGGGAKINHVSSDGKGVYSYAQFTNNTVSNTDHHTVQVGMRDVNGGGDVSLYGTAIFDHNTIQGVGGSNKKAIFFKFVGPGSSIMNTTLSDVSGQVINVLNSSPVLVDHSNWYNTGNPVNQWTDGGHNLQVDPLFANATLNDFTLSDTSPLVGAGSGGSTIGDPRWAPVISGNLAPVAAAGADIVIESDDGSETVTLDGSASYDANGDALTYSWTLDGTEVSTDVSFDYDLNLGDYTFTLTVSDGELTSSDDVVVSVINPIQYAPVADAGANIAVTSSDGGSVTVTLDGSGTSDANGDAITYSWTLDGTEVSTDVSFDYDLDIGVYTFTLTASDGALSSSDDVTVTVNSPPSGDANVALSFTGANGDYVDLGNDAELQLGDHDITVEFSFKISDGAAINQRIIGNGGTSATDDGLTIRILTNGKMKVDVSDGTTYDTKNTSFTVNDGQWHKAMFMLNRDHEAGQKMWICVDGQCNTKIFNSSIGSCANTNDTFVLGRKSTTNSADSFTGSIDEVRIWNIALTDTASVFAWQDQELTGLHPNISNLQAYYKFNENSGSTANDLTADYLGSYESDATITGAQWVTNDMSPFLSYDDEELQASAGPDCGTGDVNGDENVNVLDVVQAVAHILGNTVLTDDQVCFVDMNEDDVLNVLDVVQLVNQILNGRGVSATNVEIIKTSNAVQMRADGVVGAVQMTLNHSEDFEITLTNKALIADYNTIGNSTTLMVVSPEGNQLFTTNSEFTIESVVAASADSYLNTEVSVPAEFSISNAYPNPFNPSTTLSVDLNTETYVSMKVFNVMGQLVEVISEGNLNAGTNEITWDASQLSSGIYLINTVVGNSSNQQKVMLLK